MRPSDLLAFKRVRLLSVTFWLISHEVEVPHFKTHECCRSHVHVTISQLNLPLIYWVINIEYFLILADLFLHGIEVTLQILSINMHKSFVHIFFEMLEFLVENTGSWSFTLLDSGL